MSNGLESLKLLRLKFLQSLNGHARVLQATAYYLIVLVFFAVSFVFLDKLVRYDVNNQPPDFLHSQKRSRNKNFNSSRATDILDNLCKLYHSRQLTGDLCNVLCYRKQEKIEIMDYFESKKVKLFSSKRNKD